MGRSIALLLLAVTAAMSATFIEPGTPPPVPEPRALETVLFEPQGMGALIPGATARVTAEALPSRFSPERGAEVSGGLSRGDEVVIIGIGPRESVDGRDDFWYEIADGVTEESRGWCFGGGLELSATTAEPYATFQRAVTLCVESGTAAAHAELARLDDGYDAVILTDSGPPAIYYTLGPRGVHLICSDAYGVLVHVDEGSNDPHGPTVDGRYLTWSTGFWVFGCLYVADLRTGTAHALGLTDRRAVYAGDGVFLTRVLDLDLETDPGERPWLTPYHGALYDPIGVALFHDGVFTMLLPEERYYSWWHINDAGSDAEGRFVELTAYANLDPTGLPAADYTYFCATDEELERLAARFRARLDVEAGRVTSLEPLD